MQTKEIDAAAEFVPKTLSTLMSNPDSPVRIYADGVYDLFHFGHVEQLKQAKEAFTNAYLIVGVVTDEDCIIYKGGPTVLNHQERVRSVKLCQFVDEVIEVPPFYPTVDFINAHKIDMVAHDAVPYSISESSGETSDCYAPFKKMDRFLETQRAPMISTTDLVQRILDRSVEYQKRNQEIDAASEFVPKTLSILNSNPDSPLRIYADGVYDLFHFGHLEQLKQAKEAFKNVYLIVGGMFGQYQTALWTLGYHTAS